MLERCLLKALPAAEHLRQQREILSHLYEGFEFVAEGPVRPEGAGEGFTLTFRFLDEEENESQAQAFYLTLGPLICQLLLASPDRPDRDRDRLFTTIAKTLAFRQVDFLSKAQSAPLTSEILRTPQPAAARGWPGAWRKFPRACVSLPVPSGWEMTEEDGDAVFRSDVAEVRLHRDLEGHGDPGLWFADRMKRLQDSGDLLLGSETGNIKRGSYAAILYEEKGVGRTWKTAAVNRNLDLFLNDQQSLLWTLKAPEAGFSNRQSLFESLVAAADFLEPTEWETKLAEPWIDYTLRGAWQAEGSGVYTNTQREPILLNLRHASTTLALEALQPSILDSLRQGFDLNNPKEHLAVGAWRLHDALHYSMNGYDSNSGLDVHVRAAWLIKDTNLFSIFIRGSDPASTDHLSRSLLEAFRIDFGTANV